MSLVISHLSNTSSTFTVTSPGSPSSLADIACLLLIVYALVSGGYWTWLGLVLGGFWGRSKTGAVLEESILAIRGLGLQLTTTRGILLSSPFTSTPHTLAISYSRHFLPLSSISDVVINEGISGWQIIYYLVILQEEGKGVIKLRIGYPELLPRLAEVQQAWRGIRCTLFDEMDETSKDDTLPDVP